MDIPTTSYLNEKGELSPACRHSISTDCLIGMLKNMLLTRHMDERMLTLQRQGKISFAMSSKGEEGCVTASAAALDGADWIYPQYREQAALFYRGYPIQDFVHHMFCNAEDSIRGRQMPNHFGSRQHNVVTVSSPIGTQLPHAAGCGYAMMVQGEKSVAFCYFGDGTSSQSDFHVALNFAAVRKAPVLFFCRNNGYAISTKLPSQLVSDGIASRGAGYGIPAYRVDGNDVFAVHEVVSQARRHAVEGKGPVLIEAMTYRLGAHSTSDDPSQYRSDDEVKLWEQRCPILRLRRYLESQGLWSQSEEDEYMSGVQQEVTEAIQVAEATPEPDLHVLIEEVYFAVPFQLEEQLEELRLASEEVESYVH